MDTYTNFKKGMDLNFGFMLNEGMSYTSPLWMGEFGESDTSTNYWQFLMQYMQENPTIGWAYWSWNGYASDPTDCEHYGIMSCDMSTV